ncbi:XrtA/PEP-CTERM system TPR-repeat protein PrsT [Burkholderiaceae bacterium UC74_6]
MKTRNRSSALPGLPAIAFATATAVATAIVVAALAAWPPSARAQTPAPTNAKVARYYEDALKRYERKDFSGAVVQLKNAIAIDNNQLAVHLLLGKALLASADVASAEVEFSEALRLGVNRSEVVLPLAQTLIAQGKPGQVFEDTRLRADGLPREVQFQLLLIRSSAYSDVGDKRNAMESLLAARALNPADVTTWIAEVPLRVRNRQLPEASIAADQALKLAPGNADAIYQKASVQHIQGQLANALAGYGEAIKVDAGHFDARLARAGILIDLGRDKEALADVVNLRSLSDADPRVSYLGALLAQRAGDTAASKAALKDVTEFLDPVPMEYLRYRVQSLMLNGMAHFGLGEYEKAKPYLDLAYRQQPTSPLAKLVAQIAIAEPNMPRAIEVLEDYLKARPGDGQALLMLASAHMAQGRYSKAASLMEAALRAKDAPEFHTALGLSLMRSGQGSNALTELEKAFKNDSRQTYAGLALVDLYLRAGNPAKARATADALVKAAPDNPTMLMVQAQTRMRSNDLAGARQGFEHALRLSPDLLPAKIGLAHADILDKKYPAADARLRTLIRENDRNVDVLFEMATLHEQWGHNEESLKWLEQAVEASGPRQTQANQALVAWHLGKKAPKKALEAAKMLVAKAPDDTDSLRTYARARAANDDMAGARQTLGDAVRKAGFEPATLVGIAQEQLQYGDVAGAAYSTDKALTTSPDLLQAQVLMATIELRQGALDKADRRAQSIVRGNPKLAVGYQLQADVATARGQQPAVVEALKNAHALENSSRSLLAYFKAQEATDAKAARSLLEAWLKTHPGDTIASLALGNSLARAGNLAGARQQFEGVLRQQPKNVEALNNLANVLLAAKDAGATAVAERALALAPAEPLVIDTAGWAAFQAGNKDRALQLLRDARLRAPANREIRYHLAAVLVQSGRKDEAREELKTALANVKPGGPGFEGDKEARALLDTLK